MSSQPATRPHGDVLLILSQSLSLLLCLVVREAKIVIAARVAGRLLSSLTSLFGSLVYGGLFLLGNTFVEKEAK